MSDKGIFEKVAEYIRGASEDSAPSAKSGIQKTNDYVRGSSGTGTGMADRAVEALSKRRSQLDELNDEVSKSIH